MHRTHPFILFALLATLAPLAACTTIEDIARGSDWCSEGRHAVETTDEGGSYSENCWDEGVVCSLRNAIKSTQLCEVPQTLVLEGSGTYVLSLRDDRAPVYEAFVPIEKDLTIEGHGASIEVDADAERGLRLFQVAAGGSLRLVDVSLRGGSPGRGARRARENGGAILNAGTLTVENVTFEDNRASQNGGAIYSSGTLTVDASVLRGNHAITRGGAIYASGVLEVIRSTVDENVAVVAGGGIHVGEGGELHLEGSTVSGNLLGSPTSATGDGGGVSLLGAGTRAVIERSTVSGNLAQLGAGVHAISGARATLHDATVTANRNTLPNAGAGLSGEGFSLINVVVAANVDGFNCLFSDVPVTPSGLDDDGSCRGLRQGFADLGPLRVAGGAMTATHALGARSEAVDAGGSACLSTDQNDHPRPANRACDMGAVEMP